MCMQSRLRKTLFTRLQESRSATNASCLQHSKVTSAGESKGRRAAKVRVCARHIKVQRGPQVVGPLKCSNQSVKAQPKRAKSGLPNSGSKSQPWPCKVLQKLAAPSPTKETKVRFPTHVQESAGERADKSCHWGAKVDHSSHPRPCRVPQDAPK